MVDSSVSVILFVPKEISHAGFEITFNEMKTYLQGLFQHGSATPSVTPRPHSTPRQRDKLRISSFQMDPDRPTTQTQSLSTSGFTLLSQLNEDCSGYATPESIIEVWEKHGVTHSAQILEYLQFDCGTKINLSDLSYALNQELKTTEEDNATYQAALVSYHTELRHLKTTADSATGERDKLKASLTEANARNALLLKEGEDSQNSLEKMREKEIKNMEKKHQEQIKQINVDKEQDREVLVQQSAKERHKLEKEIVKLKEEETRLKDKLSQTQKELEKLEHEISEMTEKCVQLEKAVVRQQKELDSAGDLQRKLEEMESTRDDLINENREFADQKIELLEAENKELKDKNDEVTVEVEELKQQLVGKKQRRSRTTNARFPNRSGSVLSDYSKPVIPKQISQSSDENTPDEDGDGPRRGRRRSLPKRPHNTGGLEGVRPLGSQDKTVILTESELKKMEMDKEEKIRQLEQAYSIERKDVEEMFKMQITELEEQHDKEKDDLIKFFHREKDGLKSRLDTEFETKLAENEQKWMKEFADEKQDLFLKWETEKNHLQQVFVEEKHALEDKIRNEMNAKMKKRLKEKQESFEIEMDNSASKNKEELAEEQKQKAKLERELNKLREEFQVEKVEMMNEFTKEKATLEDKYEKQIKELEDTIQWKGKEGLRGRLQADFYALLEKEKQEITIEQIGNKKAIFEEEKTKMVKNFEKEKEALAENYKQEKETLEKKYQEIVGDIKLEKLELNDRLNVEKVHLEKLCKQRNEELTKEYELNEEQLRKQKADLQEKVNELERIINDLKNEQVHKDKMMAAKEEELSKDIQQRFEEEFVEQIERLKDAFDKERSQLEANVIVLQEELDEVNNTKKVPEVKFKLLEDELSEIKTSRNLLQETNQELEKTVKVQRNALEEQRKAENKISELQRELEDVKLAKKIEAKEEIEKVYAEKENALNSKVRQEEEKVNNANISLRLAEVAHEREKQELQDKMYKMVGKDQYDLIHEKYISAQNKVAELEQIVENREKEASKMVANTHSEYRNKIKELSAEKGETDKKLSNAQDLLKEQTAKLLEQLERNNKTDFLIKDLYVENSQLMKTLYDTERRAKETNSKMNHLDEKYRSLQNVVTKISMAALA